MINLPLRHEFVQYAPDRLDPGMLYIALEFGTVVHACCCGCGSEVVTPLSPTDWKLTYDGETISLYPSIGNRSLPCQSHYYITKSRVHWAPAWSKEKIAAGRAMDQRVKATQFGIPQEPARSVRPSRWQRWKTWWRNGETRPSDE